MNIENKPNLGYVIWEKIPRECLFDHHHPSGIDYKKRTSSTIADLKLRHVHRIRLGISWCEWKTKYGRSFIEWYLTKYVKAGFDVLPCLCFVPPELSVSNEPNGRPYDLISYAEFVYEFCTFVKKFGLNISHIEHWNEWTMDTDWNQKHDPFYSAFTNMIAAGCLVASHFGKKNVLGGMAGVSKTTLQLFWLIAEQGLMDYLDVIGFHVLRGTWSDDQSPEPLSTQTSIIRKAASHDADPTMIEVLTETLDVISSSVSECVRDIIIGTIETRRISNIGSIKPKPHVWLTEYGFPTTNLGLNKSKRLSKQDLEEIQVALYADALICQSNNCPRRAYWYGLYDCKQPSLRKQRTGWEDRLQHHFGDSDQYGKPKLLAKLLIEGGGEAVIEYANSNNLSPLVQVASLNRTRSISYHRGVGDVPDLANKIIQDQDSITSLV